MQLNQLTAKNLLFGNEQYIKVPVLLLLLRREMTFHRAKAQKFSEDDAKIAYSEIYDKIEAETDIRKRNIIQNKTWYKIYQKHESQAQVYVSHRDFLLCRDMSIMTIWIFIGFEILSLFIGTGLLSGLTTVFIIEFLIIWIATRVKGKRFAYNVIAKDLGSSKENKDIDNNDENPGDREQQDDSRQCSF